MKKTLFETSVYICIFSMLESIKIPIRFINVIGMRLLLSMILVISSGLTHVMASSAVSPNISVSAFSVLGNPIFDASVGTSSFEVSIEFPGGSLNKSDLYFGIIQPINDIHTWVTIDGVSNLKQGLVPIVKGIDMKTKFVLILSSLLGQEVKYQFTESDPSGMHLIFALLVVADRTPSDTKNWVGVSITPLFFNP